MLTPEPWLYEARKGELDGEGWEIKDRSILTQALESWVFMAILALEAKTLWEKGRKEKFPQFGFNPNLIFKIFY